VSGVRFTLRTALFARMRLFSGRGSLVWSRPMTGLSRSWLETPKPQNHIRPSLTRLVLLGDTLARHDGAPHMLTQARRLRPYTALNARRSPVVTPLVWGLRFRLKGKTMRIRRIMRRHYLLRIGTAHPSTSAVLFGISFRHTAKQKQSA
jgi:hypothetical protein